MRNSIQMTNVFKTYQITKSAWPSWILSCRRCTQVLTGRVFHVLSCRWALLVAFSAICCSCSCILWSSAHNPVRNKSLRNLSASLAAPILWQQQVWADHFCSEALRHWVVMWVREQGLPSLPSLKGNVSAALPMIFSGFHSLFSSLTSLQNLTSMPTFSWALLPRSRGFCKLSPSRHYSAHHILLAIKLLKKTLFEYNNKKKIQFDPSKSTFSPNQIPPSLKALSKHLPIINDGKISTFCSAQAVGECGESCLTSGRGSLPASHCGQPPTELITAI